MPTLLKTQFMKAILEYDLNDQDDKAAHYRAIMSLEMAIAINETYNLLRAKVKYGEYSEEVDEQLNLLKIEFHQILHQNNLIIDNLLT
jgi:hypothetical protein